MPGIYGTPYTDARADDPYLVGSNPRAVDALAELDILPRLRRVVDEAGTRHSTSTVCPRHILAPPSWEPPAAGMERGRFRCGLCGRRLVRRVTYRGDLEARRDWEVAVAGG